MPGDDSDFLVTAGDEWCSNCGTLKPGLRSSEDFLMSLAYNP
jgi:hypothetical protein